MSDWLYMSSKSDDFFMQRVREKGQSVTWVDRIPFFEDIRDKVLVVENFTEEALKEKSLQAISEIKDWNGVVASAIYGESATRWAKTTGLKRRLVGCIPFADGHEIRSFELLRGEITEEDHLHLVKDKLEGLGFVVVICKDMAGGILPRTLAAMINEAAYMVQSGIATIEEVDTMMRMGANFPLGPFEWADRIGLDRILALLEALCQELGPMYHPCPWIRRKVEAGYLGLGSGRGFYPYPEGGAL